MKFYPEASPLPDTDYFSHLAVAEAGELAERDPTKLTERQLRMIATYDLGAAQRYAHRRAEAREKAWAVPSVEPKATRAAPEPRGPRLPDRTNLESAFETTDGFEAWARANSTCVVQVDLWARFVIANRKKREALERKAHQVDTFAMRIEALESQIKKLWKELDDRPIGAIDAGVWEAGKSYRAGAGVTFEGHYWIAQKTTATAPGDGNPEWRLAVHRGKAGRDGRDLRAS